MPYAAVRAVFAGKALLLSAIDNRRHARTGAPFNHDRAASASGPRSELSHGSLRKPALGPCLKSGREPRHELVHPKHLLAALHHNDVTVPEQRGNFLRLQCSWVFMPAETFVHRQQVVEMAHQRADAIDAVDTLE